MNKNLILSFLLLSMPIASYAVDYSCHLYNLKAPEPIEQAIDYEFYIDLYKNESLVIRPSLTLGEAKTTIIRGQPDFYKIQEGEALEESYFYLSSETDYNMLEEYVQEMSQRHELDKSKTQTLKENLNQEFDNKVINGTHVALGQVQGFLSCQKR